MNGSRSCLRTGDRLVVDTQILKWAAINELRPTEGRNALAVMERILLVCPAVFVGARQVDEIVPIFARHVGRRLDDTLFFSRLDDANKTGKVRLSRSASRALDKKAKRFLSDIQSASDYHLFETARALDGILITDDGRLLDNRGELRQLTGVTILGYRDILPCAEESPGGGSDN